MRLTKLGQSRTVVLFFLGLVSSGCNPRPEGTEEVSRRNQDERRLLDALDKLGVECNGGVQVTLTNHQVTPRGAIAPEVLALLEQFVEINLITLSGTRFTDEGLAGLRRLRGVHTLALDETRITDGGLRHLSEIELLEKLILDKTPVTDAGLAKLGRPDRLVQLSLNETKVVGPGMVRFKGLTTVSLNGTPFSDASLKHLQALPYLLDLSLNSTRVGDEGMTHLAKLTGLQRLYLAHTAVSDVGLRRLAALERLDALDLRGCKRVSENGISALEDSVPGLKVRRKD